MHLESIWMVSVLWMVICFLPSSVSSSNIAVLGAANSTTGGGNATPIIPKSIDELVSLLTGDTPRVIVLNKMYDFRGSMGKCVDCKGCKPPSETCGTQGQLALDDGRTNWCANYPKVKVTYDKAGINPIIVGSNKSLIGKGPNTGIVGRGLFLYLSKNVIIRDLTIEKLNEDKIWGGDALQLKQVDNVVVKGLTFQYIGRQMISMLDSQQGRVTIQECQFLCGTSYSATCNKEHYWTFLIEGSGAHITMAYNLFDGCSGRAPRIAGHNLVVHALGNRWKNDLGHAFDTNEQCTALVEGNTFDNVAQTLIQGSKFHGFAPTDAVSAKQCMAALGRPCLPNRFINSKPFASTMSIDSVANAFVQKSGSLPAEPLSQLDVQQLMGESTNDSSMINTESENTSQDENGSRTEAISQSQGSRQLGGGGDQAESKDSDQNESKGESSGSVATADSDDSDAVEKGTSASKRKEKDDEQKKKVTGHQHSSNNSKLHQKRRKHHSRHHHRHRS